MVVGDGGEGVDPGGEILVALSVGVEDIALDRWESGLRHGSVGLVVVEEGAVARGQPIHPGCGARHVDGASESGGVLR
jgi:hypothetical protein